MADEEVLQRAMKRAVILNLDGPTSAMKGVKDTTSSHSPSTASMVHSGTPIKIFQPSFTTLSDEQCSTNLGNMGIILGNTTSVVSFSINALKRIEVDRLSLVPKHKHTDHSREGSWLCTSNSDEEDDNSGADALIDSMVNDMVDVDLDDSALDTKICDLKASARKFRMSTKHMRRRSPPMHTKNYKNRVSQ